MPMLSVADDLDLITGTLQRLNKKTFVQIAQTLNRFPTVKRLMKKAKVEFKGGRSISQTMQHDHSDSAYHTGLFGDDVVNIADTLIRPDVPWRMTTVPMMWERGELLMNTGEEEIVDIIKTRKSDRDLALATKVERTLWSKPDDSNDTTTPYGVPMYVVKNATQGFNGGNPVGFTSGVGGISSSTYPNWANWTDTYVNFTKDDFVDAVSEMAEKTFFEAPTPDSEGQGQPTGEDRGYYTTYTVYRRIKKIGEGQNENLGRDIDSMRGKVTIGGIPVSWVPALDADTDNPFYQLDWLWAKIAALKGGWMFEHDAEKYPGKHNTYVVWTDMWWNLWFKNRRAHGVIYQVS